MDQSNPRPEIGLYLAITSQLYQSRIEMLLGGHDLSYSQFSLLNHLQRLGKPDSISEIAAAMEINQPGVTKVAQRLSERGLVSIDVDPSDSRKRRVAPTAAANELLEVVSQTLKTDAADWFTGWSDNDLASFRDRLADLAGWLDANRLE